MEMQKPPAEVRDVFVVSGRNDAAREALFEFLRSIDLHPIEWSEAKQTTGIPNPYIGEILDAAFLRAHAVVVLFTPDDEARLRNIYHNDEDLPHEKALTGQARPNVLFEAGMAMGRYPEHTILVELGNLRPFSDIAGRHVIRMNDSTERRQQLAQSLQAAGCPANLDGTDWHTAGKFETAIEEPVPHSSVAPLNLQEQFGIPQEPQYLSKDAKELLIEATRGKLRGIQRLQMAGGVLSITTHGKSFGGRDDPRLQARWDQALRELVSNSFIEDESGNGILFRVTHKGFQFADTQGDQRT